MILVWELAASSWATERSNVRKRCKNLMACFQAWSDPLTHAWGLTDMLSLARCIIISHYFSLFINGYQNCLKILTNNWQGEGKGERGGGGERRVSSYSLASHSWKTRYTWAEGATRLERPWVCIFTTHFPLYWKTSLVGDHQFYSFKWPNDLFRGDTVSRHQMLVTLGRWFVGKRFQLVGQYLMTIVINNSHVSVKHWAV